MKSFILKKKFLLSVFVLTLMGIVLFLYFLGAPDRRPAQVSSTEMRYAEILLEEQPTEDEDLLVAPVWEDSLEQEEEPEVPTLTNHIESQLKKEYEQKLINHFKERESQREKLEYVNEFLRRAREDGYDLTIDEDFNVIDVQKIPEKEKPIYKIPVDER